VSHIDEYEVKIYGFIAGVLCFIAFLAGRAFSVDDLKQQAVQLNHAEWEVDDRGRTRFKWKEAKP
jgi:hypothetical protein